MEEFKGIKEKWFVKNAYTCDHKRIMIKTDDCLAVGFNDYDGDFISVAICGNSKQEVVQANALLISKAPEMLEMLKSSNEILDALYSLFSKKMGISVKFGVKSQITEIEQLITEATKLN